MIDDIIKLLLAMPPLDLTSDANKELLWRANQLGDELSLTSFKNHLAHYPKSVFTHGQRHIIFTFLTHWQHIKKELSLFVMICNAGWQEIHLSLLGGDDILPLYIKLLPQDKATLSKLYDALTIAVNLDTMSYHLTVLHSAVRHLLYNTDNEDDTIYANALPVVASLQNPENYVFLYIAVRFSKFLKQRQRICTNEIFTDLSALDIHDFDVNVTPDNKGAYLYHTGEKILEMSNCLDKDPLVKQPELIAKIKKFIAYHELYTALQRAKFPVTRKLSELTSKFEVFKTDLGHDLDNVYINVPAPIQALLNLPPIKSNSLINLLNATFFTPSTQFPLHYFMTHLSRKLDMIAAKDQVNQEVVAALNVIAPDAVPEDHQSSAESAAALHATLSVNLPR